MNTLELEDAIDAYNDLRERIGKMTHDDPSLMGTDAWLVNAMSPGDMTLSWGPNGIAVYGSCYTMQTMSHESFGFMIPHEKFSE